MHLKQVIREAKATTRRAAAKRFGVDPKRVREWLANENKILETPKRRQRIDGSQVEENQRTTP